MIEIPFDMNGRFYPGAREKIPAWGRTEEGKVWLRCPNCRTSPILSDSHDIAADGTVSPSVWHECGTSGANESRQDWHVFVRLLDY